MNFIRHLLNTGIRFHSINALQPSAQNLLKRHLAVKEQSSSYDFLIAVSAAGVSDGHGGGTAFTVPGEGTLFGNATDGHRVNGRNVAIAVAIVATAAAVTCCPHVDDAFTLPALSHQASLS